MRFYPPIVRYPRIFQDVPCDRCGYNLRGLSIGGQCPECGQFNFSSYNRHRERRFDLPEFCIVSRDDPDQPQSHAVFKHFRKIDAAWLRRIALGITLLLAGNVLSTCFAWLTWLPQLGLGHPSSIRWSLHLFAWALCAAGVILMAAPEPGTNRRGERRILKATRAAAVLWWLTPLLAFAGRYPVPSGAKLVVLAVPLTLVVMAALGRVLEAISKPRLAIQCNCLALLLPVVAVVLVVLLPDGNSAELRKAFFELAPVPGIGSATPILTFRGESQALMSPRHNTATVLAMLVIGLFVWTQGVLLLALLETRQAARRFAEMAVTPSRSSTASLPPA